MDGATVRIPPVTFERSAASDATAASRPEEHVHRLDYEIGDDLLFQVLTEREEKNSVAIASNESFGWLDQNLRPAAVRRDR